MKLKEFLYLIKYSVKQLLLDFISIFHELKKPKTWLYVMVTFLFYGIYKNDVKIISWSWPIVIVIYIIRQKIEADYRNDWFKNSLMHNIDNEIMSERYQTYKKKCIYSKYEIKSYSDWKLEELKKII